MATTATAALTDYSRSLVAVLDSLVAQKAILGREWLFGPLQESFVRINAELMALYPEALKEWQDTPNSARAAWFHESLKK